MRCLIEKEEPRDFSTRPNFGFLNRLDWSGNNVAGDVRRATTHARGARAGTQQFEHKDAYYRGSS